MRFCTLTLCALALTSCGSSVDDGPVDVVIIGEPESLFQEGVRLAPAAQHLRAATHEGLVALDASGQVIPAIAERWIITDDGQSYIFRLRDSTWPDGEEISAADVRVLLNDNLRRLRGTSLGLDLAKVTEVRAMTGRVVEVRLSAPMPEFLRLLAQPEMGLVQDGGGAGPMITAREEQLGRLSALPPQERGLPARQDWEETSRPMTVRSLPEDEAVAAFANGDADILLNGQLANFPSAQLGPLSQGNIRIDPAFGLFGIVIRNDDGVLADPQRREALSMAVDREEMIAPFGLGGWQSTTWIVPLELLEPVTTGDERWQDLSMPERRSIAARRIAAWESESGEEAILTLALPRGPGSDLMFEQIAADWRDIGLTIERVDLGERSDLELRDRLARYSSPRWFLNQFNCELDIGLCSEAADALVSQSLTTRDPRAKALLFAEAHSILVREEIFIPLGVPVRWSLVRGTINAYQPNQWGLHPLFPLSQPTI